jgi:serine protease Do
LWFLALLALPNFAAGQQQLVSRETPLTREQMYDALAEDAMAANAHYSLVPRIVKIITPSVVHIEAKKKKESISAAGSEDRTQPVVEEAGSGVILRYLNQNFVITNYHVVEDSTIDDIRIEADSKIFYPTKVVHDAPTDLSVLFIDRLDVEIARTGKSSEVEIGDFVVAIGSPFGLSHSVSQGIISAKGRRDLELGPQGVRFQDFFQTDAAINPGNSGGPLINTRGEVIGINTAIASNSGGSDGIGFSIPIEMAMRIARDLIKFGEVHRGFLGVSLDSRYTPSKGRSVGLDLNYGTRVSAVTPGSPAEKADLRVGDVITEFDQVKIESDSHLVTEVSLREIGNEVPVKIFRAGEFKIISVKIENRNSFDPRG